MAKQIVQLAVDDQPEETKLDAAIKEAHRVAKSNAGGGKTEDSWVKTQITKAAKAGSG